MNLFQFKEGNVDLLDSCDDLWQLFINNQVQNAGEMSVGVAEYLSDLKNVGLRNKIEDGNIHVQLVFTESESEAIAFCITSLTRDRIGEVEALYVIERYQGNKIGGRLFQNALAWMEQELAIEQRLIVATGNERVFDFYSKYGFVPGYTTLFRVTE